MQAVFLKSRQMRVHLVVMIAAFFTVVVAYSHTLHIQKTQHENAASEELAEQAELAPGSWPGRLAIVAIMHSIMSVFLKKDLCVCRVV